MRTFFLLFLSLAALAGETPNIRGTILDPSNRPVEGARVECGGRSTTSGADGRFILNGVDRCEGIFQKQGFETRKAPIDSSQDNRVVLKVAGLSEVVIVSATRAETTPEQAVVPPA